MTSVPHLFPIFATTRTWVAGHVIRLEFRGLQGRLQDWRTVPWMAGGVVEGRLRDGVLRAQVVVEGGPVWAIEAIVQVVRPRAILIAWPEVDPGLPLCFNPGHVAQLRINLCQGGGREEAGPSSRSLLPGCYALAHCPKARGSPLGLVLCEHSWQYYSPHRLPHFTPKQ